MIRLSLFEKIKSLVDLVSSSYFFIFVLFIFILISIYLFNTVKKDEVKTKKTYIFAYAIIMFITIAIYNSQIFDLVDYLINNIFIILCFPNLASYILMIIILNVVMIKTVFSKKIKKYLKLINILVYSSVHFILILILDTITKNNIDVYDQTSLYSNQELLNLVSLSVFIFIAWLIINVILYFINKTNYQIKAEPIVYKNDSETKINTIDNIKTIDNIQTNTIVYNKFEENIKDVNLEDLKLEDYKRLRNLLIQMKEQK